MIYAIIRLSKEPDFKELKKELDFFDDISFSAKDQVLLRYNATHGADAVFNEQYNMSAGEIHAINILGKISKKYNAAVTFWI